MSIATPSVPRRISIVIPALNEEKVVDRVVRDIHARMQASGFADFELILIDDGSTDRTGEIMEALAHDLDRVHVLHNRPNIGLGASYWLGVRAARFEYLMMLCGDGGLPAASLPPILAKVGQADIVIPFMRNMRDVRTGGRLAVSGAYTALLNALFSLRLRYYNGLPVHRREFLLHVDPLSTGFAFQAEVLVKLLTAGCSYVEVPVEAAANAQRSTALRWRNIKDVTLTLAHLLWQCRLRPKPGDIFASIKRPVDDSSSQG
jgi:glycosyltransferase involved in cell wall biosynthesis